MPGSPSESQLKGWSPVSQQSQPPPTIDMEALTLDDRAGAANAAAPAAPAAQAPAQAPAAAPAPGPAAAPAAAPAPAPGPHGKPPKPKLSKKERRELQERQRAEKAARRASQSGGSGAAGAAGAAAKAAKAAAGAAPAAPAASGGQGGGGGGGQGDRAVSQKQVPLFSHLPQYEREGSLSLNVGFSSQEIHPAMVALGLQYAEGHITGATARCVAMLAAFQRVVADYEPPADKVLRNDLDKRLKPLIQFLIDCRPHSVSMGNAIKWLRNLIAHLDPELEAAAAKEYLGQQIGKFVQERITLPADVIADRAVSKISDGDVVLTYARSHVVEHALREAHRRGRRFQVVLVDSRPQNEARPLLRRLSRLGIRCTYVLLNGLSYAMRGVTKVFLGAAALMSNGAVVSRVGTAAVAMVARAYHVPVLVCCETYKFCERVQLDSICSNELGDPDELILDGPSSALSDWRDLQALKLLNLKYDLTPIHYVSMVITEVGMTPPTSVPVLIREYRRDDPGSAGAF